MYVYTEDNHILIVLDQAVLISPNIDRMSQRSWLTFQS